MARYSIFFTRYGVSVSEEERTLEFPNPRYQILRNTQVAIFRESGIAPDDVEGIIKLLSPKIIADRLGLDYIEWDDVQPDSSEFRIAGILDRTNKHIYVSQA